MTQSEKVPPVRSAGHGASHDFPANPFRTEALRPGTIDFLLRAGVTLEQLAKKFLAEGRRAQIVGAHGSGKSTLVRTLIPVLEPHFEAVKLVRVSAEGNFDTLRSWSQNAKGPSVEQRLYEAASSAKKQRFSPSCLSGTDPYQEVLGSFHPSTLVVIEGLEQLTARMRRLVGRRCGRANGGLLVTTHRVWCRSRWAWFGGSGSGEYPSATVPVLYQTIPDWQRFSEVVQRCLGAPEAWWRNEWVREAFDRHQPNLREAFFELYDRYEWGRSRPPRG